MYKIIFLNKDILLKNYTLLDYINPNYRFAITQTLKKDISSIKKGKKYPYFFSALIKRAINENRLQCIDESIISTSREIQKNEDIHIIDPHQNHSVTTIEKSELIALVESHNWRISPIVEQERKIMGELMIEYTTANSIAHMVLLAILFIPSILTKFHDELIYGLLKIISTQEYFIGVALTTSVIAILFKYRNPIIYGVLEIAFGIFTITTFLSKNQDSSLLLIKFSTSVFIIIRGLDSIVKSDLFSQTSLTRFILNKR